MENISNNKESVNSGHMSHQSKSRIIVMAMLLLKVASHNTIFVELKITIEASLDLIYPLAHDGTRRGRRGNDIPGFSALQQDNLLC
jgi:hypothetical protein